MAETMPPPGDTAVQARRFFVSRHSGNVWYTQPVDDEFRAYWAVKEQFKRRYRERGERLCWNKHQHLDVYGSPCDECRACV